MIKSKFRHCFDYVEGDIELPMYITSDIYVKMVLWY